MHLPGLSIAAEPYPVAENLLYPHILNSHSSPNQHAIDHRNARGRVVLQGDAVYDHSLWRRTGRFTASLARSGEPGRRLRIPGRVQRFGR